jgi:2-oxoglutarate ferredoxin oxidoreductase subunit gamma
MEFRCIFAGSGGQGVVSMGTLLAYAGMMAGRHTSFFPAYGIAMRGGNANCTVIVSDGEIASPVVFNPDMAAVMNQTSFDYFETRVVSGGRLFINSSMAGRAAVRTDIKPVYVPATELAVSGGDCRMANMAMLGAVMKITGMLPLEVLVKAVEKLSSKKIQHLVSKNKKVLEMGYAAV